MHNELKLIRVASLTELAVIFGDEVLSGTAPVPGVPSQRARTIGLAVPGKGELTVPSTGCSDYNNIYLMLVWASVILGRNDGHVTSLWLFWYSIHMYLGVGFCASQSVGETDEVTMNKRSLNTWI